MTETEANTLALMTNTEWIIISTIAVILIFIVGKRTIYKKYVGRDDKSLTIKDSDIKDSFNGKR